MDESEKLRLNTIVLDIVTYSQILLELMKGKKETEEVEAVPRYAKKIVELRQELFLLSSMLGKDRPVVDVRNSFSRIVMKLESLSACLIARGVVRKGMRDIIKTAYEIDEFLSEKPGEIPLSKSDVRIQQILRNYIFELERFLQELEHE